MNSFFLSHRDTLLVNIGNFVDYVTPIYLRNCMVVTKTLVKPEVNVVKIWPFVCYYVEKKYEEDLLSPVSSTT